MTKSDKKVAAVGMLKSLVEELPNCEQQKRESGKTYLAVDADGDVIFLGQEGHLRKLAGKMSTNRDECQRGARQLLDLLNGNLVDSASLIQLASRLARFAKTQENDERLGALSYAIQLADVANVYRGEVFRIYFQGCAKSDAAKTYRVFDDQDALDSVYKIVELREKIHVCPVCIIHQACCGGKDES